MIALLDGRSLEDVLRASPFKYGYFQGDDGYRIWDQRKGEGFLHFTVSILDAEIWILEKPFRKVQQERMEVIPIELPD